MNQDKEDFGGASAGYDVRASQSEATELPRRRPAEISGSDAAADHIPATLGAWLEESTEEIR